MIEKDEDERTAFVLASLKVRMPLNKVLTVFDHEIEYNTEERIFSLIIDDIGYVIHPSVIQFILELSLEKQVRGSGLNERS